MWRPSRSSRSVTCRRKDLHKRGVFQILRNPSRVLFENDLRAVGPSHPFEITCQIYRNSSGSVLIGITLAVLAIIVFALIANVIFFYSLRRAAPNTKERKTSTPKDVITKMNCAFLNYFWVKNKKFHINKTIIFLSLTEDSFNENWTWEHERFSEPLEHSWLKNRSYYIDTSLTFSALKSPFFVNRAEWIYFRWKPW